MSMEADTRQALPLSPARVLVVRSGALPSVVFPRPADASRLELVEKISHEVVPLDPDPSAFDLPADLAIFTSQIAVQFLFQDPDRARRFREAISGGRVAAVGETTAESLRSFGVEADIVAAGSGASILDRLPARLDRLRVLLPRGEDATHELPEGLASRGAYLAPLVLYAKHERPWAPSLDGEIVSRPFAAFCTTSPSAARWLFHGASETAAAVLRATPAVVLGRFTFRYLESHGVERIETVPEASFVSALEKLEELAAAPSAGIDSQRT